MFFYNETTKKPEITSDEGYYEATSLLKEIQTASFLPEHHVIDKWCEARKIDRTQRIVQIGFAFVPMLMQAMINHLESKLGQR